MSTKETIFFSSQNPNSPFDVKCPSVILDLVLKLLDIIKVLEVKDVETDKSSISNSKKELEIKKKKS